MLVNMQNFFLKIQERKKKKDKKTDDKEKTPSLLENILFKDIVLIWKISNSKSHLPQVSDLRRSCKERGAGDE